MSTTTVPPGRRFTTRNPCPVCGGGHDLPQGRGVRCYGFLSADGRYAHCTRDQHAGGQPQDSGGTYAHRLDGPCRCGQTHGSASFSVNGNGGAAHSIGHRHGQGAVLNRADERPPRRATNVRRWRILDAAGCAVAVHVRTDYDDDSKDVRWERPDGRSGLGGLSSRDLPLYGIHERRPGQTTIVVEGEPARDALAPLAAELDVAVVATVTGAASTPNDDVLRPLLDGRVLPWPDSDAPGEAHMDKLHWRLREMAMAKDAIRRLGWQGARSGTGDDGADFVNAGGTTDDLRRLIELSPHWRGSTETDTPGFASNGAGPYTNAEGQPFDGPDASEAPGPARFRAFTAASLQAQTFPPLPFAVPDILPQGAALLCGPPKIGKSRLVLQIACAVAYGGVALSYTEVAKGDVLVLALEDGPRRLQERLAALLGDVKGQWPEGLAFATEWPTLDQGGAAELDAYLHEHPNVRLVIVDVLQMIRSAAPGRENAYAADYVAMRTLKAVADRHDVTLLALHHTRKLDASDPVSLVSGTNGLAGAVDSVLILQREPNGADATLYLRGRDVEEAQFTLSYERERGAWDVAGETRAQPLSETREKIVTALEHAWPAPMTPKDIASAAGLTENVVYQRLHSLEHANLIRRVQRGQYTLIEPPRPSNPNPDAPPSTLHKDRKDRKDCEEPAQPRGDSDTTILTADPCRKDDRKDENPRNGAEFSTILTNLTNLTGTSCKDGIGRDDTHEPEYLHFAPSPEDNDDIGEEGIL